MNVLTRLAAFLLLVSAFAPAANADWSEDCISNMIAVLDKHFPPAWPGPPYGHCIIDNPTLAFQKVSDTGALKYIPAHYMGTEGSLCAALQPRHIISVYKTNMIMNGHMNPNSSAFNFSDCDPFSMGYLMTILIHERLHAEDYCGKTPDDCDHLAVRLAALERTCNELGELKNCKASPECPPHDDYPFLNNDNDVQDLIDGACLFYSERQMELNTHGGPVEAMACACAQAAEAGPPHPTCPVVPLPPEGCDQPAPGEGQGYPVPACEHCN